MAKGGKGAGGAKEGPQISPEEQKRFAKAAKQLAAYANWLRWTANFGKEELSRHPRHERVMMLSPMQSGRFTFAPIADTIYLGVQSFEAVWLASMPLHKAYVSDRLYLHVEGVACIDSQLPALGIGIFVDDEAKRQTMASAKWLQLVRVRVSEGRVSAVEREIGARIPLVAADIIGALADAKKASVEKQDLSKFF